MKVSWKAHAECFDCYINLSEIEPKLIIYVPETQKKWTLCPCCSKMLTVYSASDKMNKRMICIHDLDENTSGEEVVKIIMKKANSRDKNSIAFIHEFRKVKLKMYLDLF